VAGVLEQSDSTAWMAQYCLNLLEMAIVLGEHDTSYEDLATKFFEHFTYIATALDDGLWSEEDGFYFDVVRTTEGERVPLKVRSIVGLLPLNATTTLGPETLERLPDFAFRLAWFEQNKPQYTAAVCHRDPGEDPGSARRLLAAVSPERLRRLLPAALDPDEFLSPHGLRALSAYHREHPFTLKLAGLDATVGYEPGESTTNLFGGNSNWRGPVWFPVNYLLIGALIRFDRYLRGDFTIEHPTGSGQQRDLLDVARDLADRLIGLYQDDAGGHRPAFGTTELFQRDPAWHDQLLFAEYFHGDTGAGLGATHQTGWTALIADLVIQKYRGYLAERE
jgi:hypothetical protein